MRMLKFFLYFLLILLQYSLWLGKNGVVDYIKIYKKVVVQMRENKNIDIRNNQIKLEIENLNKKL